MDPRAEVRRAAKDESSEEEERMSPGAPSIDDEVDSDKGGSNSKKRKRGSYRCSRCGMPKRGHNCPDTFDGMHFAIVDASSSGSAPTTAPAGAANSATPPAFAAPALSLDDCTRENLLVQVSTLRDENVRLVQEVYRLREVIQFHAHSSMHQHQAVGSPGAELPNIMGNAASPANMRYVQAPGVPLFAPAFSNASQQQQQQGSAPMQARPNFATPPPSSAPALNASKNAEEALPNAKRAKLEEQSQSGPVYHSLAAANSTAPPSSAPSHPPFHPHSAPYPHIHAPFPPEHAAELHHHLPMYSRHPAAAAVGEHSGHFDFDYERHDHWYDNDSSTSEYYPTPGLSPPLIY